MLSTWKTAPALAAGCTVSSNRPSGRRSPARCWPTCRRRPGSRPVSSTSSRASARRPARRWSASGVRRICSPARRRRPGCGVLGARNIVPFTGELGGKGPLLVFADADLDAAARRRPPVRRLRAGLPGGYSPPCRGVRRGRSSSSFFHRLSTTTCSATPATTRRRLAAHPSDHFARVAGFVERARANGDHIVRGGRVAELGGPVLRAHARRTALERVRDRPARGLRTRLRSRPSSTEEEASRSPTRPGTASRRPFTRHRRSAPSGSDGRSAPALCGSTVPRARSHGPFRRDRNLAESGARAGTTRSTSIPT